MGVTNENSTEYANQVAHPPVFEEVNMQKGKLRMYAFNFTQGAAAGDAGSTAKLIKLPAGRITLIGSLSKLYFSAFGTARVLDIGWTAYRDKSGTVVAADANDIDNDINVASAGSALLGTALTTNGLKEFESSTGVDIVATVAGGTIPAAATLKGYLIIAVE